MRFGAPHGSEIQYVFENVIERNGITATPKDKEVARKMNAYWVNFAKNGDPNSDGLPKWPVYHPTKNEVFDIRQDGLIGNTSDPRKARLDVMEKFAKDQK